VTSIRYIVTSGRYFVACGRCCLTSSRCYVACGRYFLTCGRCYMTSGMCYVSSGKYIVACGRCCLTSGRYVLTSGRYFLIPSGYDSYYRNASFIHSFRCLPYDRSKKKNSLLQSEFSSHCDLVLPFSSYCILFFLKSCAVAAYSSSSSFRHFYISLNTMF
jgi:hypothetical protein